MLQVKHTLTLKVILILLSIVQHVSPNYVKKYQIPNIRANWFKAVEFCHSIGMQLATVDSRADSESLISFIKSTDKFNEQACAFWLGGSDLSEEGTFSWQGTGKLVTYTNWSPGEPNNTNGTEDCIQLVYIPRFEQRWTWNDNACKRGYMYFVCESLPQNCIQEFK
ncbi:perlucin-like isoform X1 [Culex pipiens pallens]|uniref:perlucin-like isoform X1 n=1 Tax=Culex pipiens pallens TaxID=42434 RepID=UPI001952AECB|nr:perlucin-like isoform X1 [Culex pipiens pallens]XP_039446390.1 perlucin-like isoform X1 [Culex pipiens pallens]XP_039446391.1 perlucin-like isoform X1 [Culex pipiens pallens]